MGEYYTIIQGFRISRGDVVQVRFDAKSGWRKAIFDFCTVMTIRGKRQRIVYIQGPGGTSPETFTGPYTMDSVRVTDDLTAIAARV